MKVKLVPNEEIKNYDLQKSDSSKYTLKKDELAEALFKECNGEDLDYYDEITRKETTKKYTEEDIKKVLGYISIQDKKDDDISLEDMKFLNNKIIEGEGWDAKHLQNTGLGQKILNFFLGKFGTQIAEDNKKAKDGSDCPKTGDDDCNCPEGDSNDGTQGDCENYNWYRHTICKENKAFYGGNDPLYGNSWYYNTWNILNRAATYRPPIVPSEDIPCSCD